MAKIPTTGEMIHVIKFETIGKTPDNTGGQDEQGKDWFTTRGKYIERSATRSFNAGYDQGVTSGVIYVYWRQAIENDINKDTRVLYNNRFFRVQSYRVVQENRGMYEIEVKEAR